MIELACEMLNVNELPAELEQRIRRVDELCRNAGGRLVSRQVIATIIEAYEREAS